MSFRSFCNYKQLFVTCCILNMNDTYLHQPIAGLAVDDGTIFSALNGCIFGWYPICDAHMNILVSVGDGSIFSAPNGCNFGWYHNHIISIINIRSSKTRQNARRNFNIAAIFFMPKYVSSSSKQASTY